MALVGLRIKQVQGLFFDRQKVLAAVSRAERKVLSQFGAFVRQDARQRIRRRKRSSRPGESPTNQTGLLKRHIHFAFDPDRRSVVIGPARLNKPSVAPAALEYGGQTTLETRPRGRIRVRMEPRPYMGPAFEQEQPRLPALWRNSVK